MLGIFALFFRSAYELLSQTGAGYLDSLAGLVFLLLVGKWVQQRTYDSLAFDRDYRSYFPLTSTVFREGEETQVLVSELAAGDEILLRNQELIPGDAVLVGGEARIDYSFVSGESAPVRQEVGDYLYAGGRQVGPAIRLRLEKAVSQSYLTQLWEQDAFQQSSKAQLLIDRMSRWFTLAVLSIASLSALYWWWTAGVGEAVLVGTAVLIVACPCGLALTSPFIFGNAMRILGRHGWYLKNAHVLERLATLTMLVFDKTGTMTEAQEDLAVSLEGPLTPEETLAFASLAYQSSHPMSKMLVQHLGEQTLAEVEAFAETPGQGISGRIRGGRYWIGRQGFVFPEVQEEQVSGTWLSSEQGAKACFRSEQKLRTGLSESLDALQADYQLVVLSGDRPEKRAAIASAVPAGTPLLFGQSPLEKLAFIQQRQAEGERVAMLGDGLNDAGALQQSEVGIAISESADAFSPACDLIMEGKALPRLGAFLQFSRSSLRLVRIGWLISLTYNLIGLGFAVQGLLTPLVAAILMPLSSLNILAFGLISTQLAANRFLPSDKSHGLL
ncbi:MAG: HAD-IC family P-type ATPase [Bacteroidota bacterium]